MDVVPDSLYWENKHVLTRGQGHVAQYGAHAVLDVVNLLLVPIHNLVSVENYVAAKQTGEAGSEADTEEAIKCLDKDI